MAVISKGITLSYQVGQGEIVDLSNLMEIPELGGEVEAIEVTTLADEAHKYTDGLINYGDSLAFKFLYETEQFEMLQGVTAGAKWIVTLPDGAECSFDGNCSVQLDGVGVGAALTYTLNVKPNSQRVWG